jgi:pimeloyl-ACP methyl ester carboxylesterase
MWPEYYKEFPYFSDQAIRPGCHPRKLVHTHSTEKAIVLVHGLTDSPFYVAAIAEHFHTSLGYNVYLPLLQCHGLKDPLGMAGVSLGQWKKNVGFAIRSATENADRVCLGGFSTGGALSFYFGCTDPEITGELYLFSAALGLFGGRFGFLGRVSEFLLLLPFIQFLDSKRPLAGIYPYRYDRVPLISARELSRLILEIDELLKLGCDTIRSKRIFAAWSECDRVINVKKISELPAIVGRNQFVSYVLPKAAQVDHTGVVLKESVFACNSQPGDAPLEVANPSFADMMAALDAFESAA